MSEMTSAAILDFPLTPETLTRLTMRLDPAERVEFLDRLGAEACPVCGANSPDGCLHDWELIYNEVTHGSDPSKVH